MQDLLNEITGLTVDQRKKVFGWVATLPEMTVIGIFQDAVKKSFHLKNERPDLSGRIVKYCAFVAAARSGGWDTVTGKGYRIAEQKQYDDFSHLRKAKAAALSQRGRTPVIRRKIMAYWGEIKELKEGGNGFRVVAQYLAKNRKLKTSATYLARMWKEIEQ